MREKKKDSNRGKQHFTETWNCSVSNVTFLGKCKQVLGSFASTLQTELKHVFKIQCGKNLTGIEASILQLNEMIIAPAEGVRGIDRLGSAQKLPPRYDGSYEGKS